MTRNPFLKKIIFTVISIFFLLNATIILYHGVVTLVKSEKIVNSQFDFVSRFVLINERSELKEEIRKNNFIVACQSIFFGLFLLLLAIAFFKQSKISYILIILLIVFLSYFRTKPSNEILEEEKKEPLGNFDILNETPMTLEELRVMTGPSK